MNKVILLGNVASDIKVTTLDNNKKIVNFLFATDSKHKNKEGDVIKKTQFHKIIGFSPISNNIEKFVKKGSKLLIEGTVEYKKYVDEKNIEKTITKIKILSFKILDKKNKEL